MKIAINNRTLGIENNGKFIPAKGIITHVVPDLNALATPIMFEVLGIDFGAIEFKSSGKRGLVGGKSAEEWLKDGWILVDIGGGESKRQDLGIKHIDHHPPTFYPKQCAMTIALDFISSEIEIPKETMEKLKKLAGFVKNWDIHGGQRFLDLSHICKTLSNKVPPEILYGFIARAIKVFLDEEMGSDAKLLAEIFSEFSKDRKLPSLLAKYQRNLVAGKIPNIPNLLTITDKTTSRFAMYVLEEAYHDQMLFVEAEELFKEAEKIPLYRDKFMMVAETDNNQFLKVSLRNGATIVVIKNDIGHVQIFTQKKDNVNISDIAAAIRFEELTLFDSKSIPINFGALRRDGTSSISTNWYLFKQGGMLLNGSSTTPDQEPTALSLDFIIETILKAVRNYMPSCNNGIDKCEKVKCPIYQWGLDRCQRKYRQEGSDRSRLIEKKSRKGETLLLVQ